MKVKVISRKHVYIISTHFYIVKLGFIGVSFFFLIFARKHRLWVAEAVLTSTHNLYFEQKYEKYHFFLSENFQFLEMKVSVYLNRRVFGMNKRTQIHFKLSTLKGKTEKMILNGHKMSK